MEQQQLTITQVLKQIRDGLGDINVPMKHIDDIGIPIARQIAFINGCLDAIADQEKKALASAEQAPEDTEPVIEVTEATGADEPDNVIELK